MTIGRMKVNMKSILGTVKSNMEYYGLTVAAPHVKLTDDVITTCPLHFHVQRHSMETDELSLLDIQCRSCPFNRYTIRNPVLTMTNVSHNLPMEHVECLKCPLGGKKMF